MAEKRGGVKGLKEASSSDVQNDNKEKKGDEPLKTLDRLLTVEPVMLLHMTSAVTAMVAVQDLLFSKACRVNFGYSEDVCAALKAGEEGKFLEENANVQKLTGSVMMWRMMLENLFPMVLVCLVGAWSDKYGRKIPMLLVQLSFILQHILLMLSALDKSIVGANSVGFISALVVSLTGNNACFMMNAFSYASDTTPKEKMTQKMGITGSSIFLGLTVGLGVAGSLSKLPFEYTFAIAAGLELLGFLWLLFGLPNVVRNEEEVKKVSGGQMFRELFDKKHLVDAVGSVTKKRPGYERLKLLSLMMCHALVMAPMGGENSVMFLFARYKFNWDSQAFISFIGYKIILGFVGNFVSMALLGGKLKLSDPAIGIVSCVAALLSNILYAFAPTPTIMFIGPVVALLAGSINSIPRSCIFKIASADEKGKVGAFMGSLESLTPLLAAPAYSFIYTSTFEYLPGAFFLLSAAFMVPPIIVYAFMRGEDKAKTS